MTENELYSRTPEEILQRVAAEGREPTEEEKNVITANDYDITNRAREIIGEPITDYQPMNWELMHHTGNTPIYITEGRLNCLAFEALGIDCAEWREGLHEAFIQDLDGMKPSRPLIIALSRDTSGDNAQKLYRDLQRLHIECYSINPYKNSRNAAEAIAADPEGFRAEALQILKDPRAAQHRQRSAGGYIDSFIEEIRSGRNDPPISTGFNSLDRLLCGGLRPGLLVIMSPSNTGKSALVLQLSDQIAQYSKKDILYVSLEMSRSEHMARSISRLTYREAIRQNKQKLARSALEITDGHQYSKYDEEQQQAINTAVDRYREYAGHLFFMCGSQISVKQIEQAVYAHRQITGAAPVVVVDYLQLLSPEDPRADQRSNTDKNVSALVNIAKAQRTPVIAISSVSRMSYTGGLMMSSAKESGAIEYSADQLLAYQYKDQSNSTDIDAERARYPRQMELKMLKSRNSAGFGKMYLNYRPAYNLFTELE